jgi:hypothetical protein
MLEGTFYHKFVNGHSGIKELDARIVYRRYDGRYFLRRL